MNTTQPAQAVNEALRGTKDNSSKRIICLRINTNSITGEVESKIQAMDMIENFDKLYGHTFLLEVADKENVLTRLQELSQNPHIWDRAEQLQDLLFSSTLSEHEALLEAGFCDVIYEPEKYFSECQQTPVEMGLDDSIESVNEILKAGFYGDGWDIAFTVTPAEIQQYLKSHQQ